MRFFFITAIVLSLSACLTSDDVRMSTEHAQFIQKVGVISLLDSYANIHYAAQEPKDIIDRKALIKGWEVNQAVGEHIVQRLNQRGFDARLLNVNAASLAPYENSWARPSNEALRPKLYEIGGNAGVDMVVVIYRQRVAQFIAKGREKLRGYGVFKTHRIEPHLYAAVYVEALDVNKQYLLGNADGQQAAKLSNNTWDAGFVPGDEPVLLPVAANTPEAEELREVVKLAALLAAQEAGLSN